MTRQDKIIRLYEVMPSAPFPDTHDGNYLWGEVEGNDYWCFCERVVDMVEQAR